MIYTTLDHLSIENDLELRNERFAKTAAYYARRRPNRKQSKREIERARERKREGERGMRERVIEREIVVADGNVS